MRFPSATRPYIQVRGGWKYLYRAIDRDGVLVDVMLSERRDLAAARSFFRSAKAVTGVTPDRVTTDGLDAYPRAIRTVLGKHVRHRTRRYLNNRIEQDHRGIKPMQADARLQEHRISKALLHNSGIFFAADSECASTFPRLRGVITTCAEQPSPSASWKRHERDAPSSMAVDKPQRREI